MATQIPLVSYLALDNGSPHLVANTCDQCGARFLDRRNACARCGAREFSPTSLATTGKVTSFTIVQRAAPGVKVPFVSQCRARRGGSVQANIVDRQSRNVALGMPVKLTPTAPHDDKGPSRRVRLRASMSDNHLE